MENLLIQSATAMARMVREREVSSVELVSAHLKRIEQLQPLLNATVEVLADSALRAAEQADSQTAAGTAGGPLHGVPFSVKDSIDIEGVRTTAGTLGRRNAPTASKDATLVSRLRSAGAIPIAKTNLPDLLFSFETDNLLFGRTNNPYDVRRTPGGSSGGEAALIAGGGSPLGLGSDAFGSVRLPAAFCGIAGIKPTSGRLPRTGHVPRRAGWLEAVWQMGPMARSVDDLLLAMNLMAGEDGEDFTSPPVALQPAKDLRELRVAFFTSNGFATCSGEVTSALRECAEFLATEGLRVREKRPPGVEHAYELEMSIAGADGGEAIDEYLAAAGSTRVSALHTAFVDRFRAHRCAASELGRRWAQWDAYREAMARFFRCYDIVLCPVFTQTALPHAGSMLDENFHGFSYTMAWNMAGAPAATVRWSSAGGLPVNVQVVAKPWDDLLALEVCRLIEKQSGGWQSPSLLIKT